MVHGDDYASVGPRESLKWLKSKLRERFDIKTYTIRQRKEDSKELKFLNRLIRATENGYEYEADPRHAELVIKGMKLNPKESKPVVAPGANGVGDDGEGVELDYERMKAYKRIVARANCVAPDRPDAQYAIKELCRKMNNPSLADWNRLKHLARYFIARPRLVIQYD